MDESRGEVCLEVEVERLYEQGLPAEEIARRMGLDPGWVEALISLLEGGQSAD